MASRLLLPAQRPQNATLSFFLEDLISSHSSTDRAADREIRRRAISAEALLLAHNANDADHARRIARLAASLFNQLRPLHHLGRDALGWLICAAILHDIAKRSTPDRHEIVAQQIILTSRQLALPRLGRRIVGLIAKHHRKASSLDADCQIALLRPLDREIVRRLSAILRLADGMDFGRRGGVERVRCHIAPGQITLRCFLPPNVPTEVRKALKARILAKGHLLEEVFGCRLAVKWGLGPASAKG